MADAAKHTEMIRVAARDHGFSHVGFSKAQRLDEAARRLEDWLKAGYHGAMGYMANHFEKRVDPTQLVPGAKSVITLLCNYHSAERQTDPEAPKIASYALGEDYHFVIKRKLRALMTTLEEQIGAVQGRCFVDSAPVMEREWAQRSGVGWIGKNTLLIHPQAGSYFFLAEIISDLEVVPDHPIRDHCGTCTRCIDACPTDAISPAGYILDGSKCISYLTIELKDNIPSEFAGQMDNWMFGCDICQEVCPWNRFATPHQETAFEPSAELLDMSAREWHEITEDVFRRIFKKSAVKRTKFKGLKRNLAFLKTAGQSNA